MEEKCYIAIDLKSFYASVECIQRRLDPMTTYLVVADQSRTDKTICLAVSPALKAHGVPGRPRLFEVVQQIRQVNARRKLSAPEQTFRGATWDAKMLAADPSLELEYIVAPPQMALYMETSAAIYQVYTQYIAPEDIHVYSIDEVFIDATGYLRTYNLSPEGLARMLIEAVLERTGITATAGIGTNLYLCKVAMDIVAKHIPADHNGVRIARLDEMSYRKTLWDHRPLTDFWRIGRGYARKLERHGMYTMGDVARCSLGSPGSFYSEELLYELFGVNAELLIDHAWGYEPCTMAQIKAYRPETSSLSSGQVLHEPYPYEKAELIVKEMTDLLILDLVDKALLTDQIVLTIGYDIENLTDPERRRRYHGAVVTDPYGRKVPKHSHGTENFPEPTASEKHIMEAVLRLYRRIADPDLLVRRITLAACHLIPEQEKKQVYQQLDIFTDPIEEQRRLEAEAQRLDKEKRKQKALLGIQKRFGKNAVMKGMNLEEGATTKDRNQQVGGHKA